MNVENEEGNDNANRWQGKGGRIYNFINCLWDVFSGWEWDKVDSSVLLGDCMVPVAKELAFLFCGSLVSFSAHMYFFHSVSSTSFLSTIGK